MNYNRHGHMITGALQVLLDESGHMPRKILLEGGPGQGKSTITQMAVQIYRQQLLGKNDMDPEDRWLPPSKSRIPFRIELREFAKWLSQNLDGSVEQYIAAQFKKDAAGSNIDVDDIHTVVQNSPILLVFDGLDEIGNDDLRDKSINKIIESVRRFENSLNVDLRVVLTTRPPAVAGRRENLIEFERLTITPMDNDCINNYVKRWLMVQVHGTQDRKRVQNSFERRQHEPHVKALARNPMQLSVLLHYIRLKGEAFPDLRADLYGDYFQIVIDREVEKREEFLRQRRTIEALHQFIGYKIHALTEAELADGTLTRQQLLEMVEGWLIARGIEGPTAQNLFKLGEERLGLIVVAKDEGEQGKYGFEVQPIREYFAAAFISNQIVGNTHRVFQVMIRHSYWREVALFLAGMRRENERSDLVERARNIDAEDELGWRMDGRSIIMQLLQEGVFSEPDHVFANALDFILDILDHKLVGFRNEPKDFVEPLASLLKRGNRRHKTRILNLIHEYMSSNDEQILYRLFRMSYQVLALEELANEIFSFLSGNLYLTAKVRLVWPYRWGVPINNMLLEENYWQGVSDDVWADSLWTVFFSKGFDSNFAIPTRLHSALFEQLSAVPILSIRHEHVLISIIRTISNLAVLRLAQLQLLLQYLTFTQQQGRIDSNIRIRIDELCDIETVDYEGLKGDYKNTIEDLLKIYRDVILHVKNTRSKREILSDNFLEKLTLFFDQPGCIGWLYIRSILNIFGAILVEGMVTISPSQYRYEVINAIKSNPSIRDILLKIQSFYEMSRDEKNDDLDDEFKISELIIYSSTYYQSYYDLSISDIMPRRLILSKDGQMYDVIDVIISSFRGERFEELDWLLCLPINSEIIVDLVNKSGNYLSDVLSYIGHSRIRRILRIKPLPAPKIRRILKIVRITFDRAILTGAWAVLSNSKFIKLAGLELIIKLMQYSEKPEMVSNIFSTSSGGKISWDQQELNTLVEVAKRISEEVDQFSSVIVTSAGSFLAEHYKLNLRPLTHDEDTLSIKAREM